MEEINCSFDLYSLFLHFKKKGGPSSFACVPSMLKSVAMAHGQILVLSGAESHEGGRDTLVHLPNCSLK